MGDTRNGSANGSRREAWRAGIAAGLLAGVAMMAFMMLCAGALDGATAALDPLRAVGTSFRGRDASTAGALPIVWGIALHLGVGGAFGLALMGVVPRDSSGGAAAMLGTGYALILMAFALPLVVPAVAPVLHDRMPANGGAWVVAHAVFGAVAGAGPALRRRMARSGRRPEERPGVLRPRTSP
jgi:hypothetical protein